MGKRKIINDPLYGFINFEFDVIYDLIDHRYFQRLRRISQMGLSSMVYPGAVHSRFHHALGALHLMTKAIRVLRYKGVVISDEEAKSASIAILLHDIGHGPFSHALESKIIQSDHEALGIQIMEMLNKEFNGELNMAIQVFKGDYHREFLHQLVSSQLDMDRMDYLNRDSFYTGVTEGKVGYERIINMLNVVDEKLVVEEKAIFSVEKFILSRRMMYWQVYLHKTSIVAEQILGRFIDRYKEVYESGQLDVSLKDDGIINCLEAENSDSTLRAFLELDDINIWMLLKNAQYSKDEILVFLSKSLVQRRLWKIILQDSDIPGDLLGKIRQKIVNYISNSEDLADYLMISGSETTQLYNIEEDEILVLNKKGKITPLSEHTIIENIGLLKRMHYVCYPKQIG